MKVKLIPFAYNILARRIARNL